MGFRAGGTQSFNSDVQAADSGLKPLKLKGLKAPFVPRRLSSLKAGPPEGTNFEIETVPIPAQIREPLSIPYCQLPRALTLNATPLSIERYIETSMAKTIDEDLAQLEKDIRLLKIEYEQYFGGGKARPPSDTEWRIDSLMKRYSDRGAEMNYNQRFRYGNLSQMYSKYREIFRKRLKQKEEGIVQRHFGAAAREIEKERTRKQAAERQQSPVIQDSAAPEFPFAISCKDPDNEMNKVELLYAAFRSAKEQAGESLEKLTVEAFQQFVRLKTDQLKKQKNAEEVEYVVTVEGNLAQLKARVKS